MPIKSVKMAQYMNDKIPGIQVPDTIIKRIDRAKDVVEESLSISAEVIGGLKHSFAGVHIMAPGWEANIPTLLEGSEIKS